MADHIHLTGNVRVAGTWTAHVLDKTVVNELIPNGGSHEREMRGKTCIVGRSSWVNPRLREDVGCVALGREVLGWEHHGRRKG